MSSALTILATFTTIGGLSGRYIGGLIGKKHMVKNQNLGIIFGTPIGLQFGICIEKWINETGKIKS